MGLGNFTKGTEEVGHIVALEVHKIDIGSGIEMASRNTF